MEIIETKAAIADRLSTVDDVTGYATKPKVLKPGDAFVRWRGWARGDGVQGTAYTATYAVMIMTPQGSEDAADAWIYEHADQLSDALAPVMYVDSFEPALMPVEGKPGGMYALMITGRTE